MPRLWSETIDEHRRAVRDATLDATAALVAEQGLPAVTMSKIAEATGIARATLYRYFPDVQAVLLAWHERQIADHLEHLLQVSRQPGTAVERLATVLETYAHLSTHDHGAGADVAAALHEGEHVAEGRRRLREFLQELIAEGVAAGDLRGDVPPAELATYCLHALGGARELPSSEAVRRLVTVTLGAVRAPH